MALLAGLFTVLFGRLLGRRWGAVTAALAITLYTILVGAGAPVVRAAIMSGIALLSRQLGRRQSALNSLAFVAGVDRQAAPAGGWAERGSRGLAGAALSGDAGSGEALSAAAYRLKRLDPHHDGWGADVGGGGEEVTGSNSCQP